MFLKNQSMKYCIRIVILILVISTGVLYYHANNRTAFPVNIVSIENQKDYSLINSSFLKDSLNLSRNHNIERRHHAKTPEFNYTVIRYGDCTEEIKIAVVLCGNRLNQTLVTLKSAILFSDQELHFIIVADDENREQLSVKILEWPSFILKRLSFEIHPIHFPSGAAGEEWKKLFKLCACQRLFLPSYLHHIDALLYVDTDVLFLQPVERLWKYFHKMNQTHIAALCPEHEDFATGWYNRFARHPYYEPLGVNSGVMLMNLTRMRNFKWENFLPSIIKEYKLHIVWGDQDVINIIFHFHPEKLYIFSCEWNYRPDHCMYTSVCKTAELNGIGVIHGNRGVFHNKKQPAFKAVYQAFEKCSFEADSKSNFYENLNNFLSEGRTTNCGKQLSSLLVEQVPAESGKRLKVF